MAFRAVLEEIKIKSERVSRLNTAICILNQEVDKRVIENVEDELDLIEYENLVDDDDNAVLQTIDMLPSVPNNEINNDCVEIGRMATVDHSDVTGGFEIDETFSFEYSYKTDVSNTGCL